MRCEDGIYIDEPASLPAGGQLPERVYAQALDSFVLVCADCLLVNSARRTVFLGRRRARPLRGAWWLIGGRVRAGERAEAAARRLLARETSLSVAPERLVYRAMHRYFFRDRQQEPQDRGCDALCYTFSLEASEEEIRIAGANLDRAEYEAELGLQEFDRARLADPAVPLAIRHLYERVFGSG